MQILEFLCGATQVATMAQVRSLAQELSHATSLDKKKPNKQTLQIQGLITNVQNQEVLVEAQRK